MNKTTFGLIVTTRGFFNPELARVGREKLIGLLVRLGHDYVVLGEADTRFGCVETFEDAEKCAKLFYENKNRIGGVIVSAPNFGDEAGTVNALTLERLGVPVLVHAADDSISRMTTEHRRDSFCGKLSICANFYQYGVKFTNTTLHTCDVESAEFEKDIVNFDKVCRVVTGLKSARIAQFGTRPLAFQTVRYSEKLLQKSGITILPVDMSEIFYAAMAMSTDAKVQAKIAEIRAYGNVPACIAPEAIDRSAKLQIVMEKFMDDHKCVAAAVQCWDSVQLNYQCAACLPMSMINEKGRAMACETDVTGAVAMYAMSLASGEPSGYLDWNNNYEDERDKCILIHCSSYPKSFMGTEMEISNLDILGNSLGHDKCFGACKAKVAPGDMTFAKVSTDEFKGVVKAYVGEGVFTDDSVDTVGAPATVKIENLQKLLDYMCKNGYEHHVGMNRSNVADVLDEAFSNYMGWEVYRHR